jgi:predicted RNA binding protein YcfA (HicA-like mRNA interferase family)
MKVRDILVGLNRKGFLQSESDHTHLILYVNGKKTEVRTKVSHGAREIDDHLINLMSKQVHLEKKEFRDLINCPLSLEGYLKKLSAEGIDLE